MHRINNAIKNIIWQSLQTFRTMPKAQDCHPAVENGRKIRFWGRQYEGGHFQRENVIKFFYSTKNGMF